MQPTTCTQAAPDAADNLGQPSAPGATAAQYAAADKAVTAEVARTDGKAGALLTALALPFAVLVAVVPGHDLSPLATALVVAGGGGLVLAMTLALTVVRPRLAPAAPGTWVHWAGCDRASLDADLATPDPAGRILALAGIARAKYVLLRRAVDITVVSLVLLALALPAGLI
ncbi:Pycsar system effector family protein [Kitasatospora sp. NPDC049285]|uniref:Pycsar system effector family protein n=1 Tax=Kitasatospora sp. NPDC049285 TaxID=3157096 RepID=UPI003429F501